MPSDKEYSDVASWWRGQWNSLQETWRDFSNRVLQEPSVRLMAVLGVVVFLLAMVLWQLESRSAPRDGSGDSWITTFGKSIYFMFVSGTTVGYGDLTAHTGLGRALAITIILIGIVLTSLLTATIASWFVERRIMEGRGMEKIPWNGHVVLCGWNDRAKEVMAGIYRDTKDDEDIVLINNLAEDEISEILYQYKRQGLRYVRGDFVHESVLQRASVAKARAVVILADDQKEQGYAGSDQRTVLCALVVKSMNPAIKVTAEIVAEDNVAHLRRAQVDHIVLLGENIDFLLSSSVTSPGVTLAVQELLNPRRSGPLIQQARIPSPLIDQSFAELSRHFREKQRALVIGVLSREEKGMSLDDILSEDMSAIDHFIKSQFEGLEHDYFNTGSALKVRINPPDDYKIHNHDRALLIADAEARGGGGGQS